jgi:isoaspartyl peptidase/L-asparaginase-like protein (Ntn-hydrolase superfamily)
MKTNNKPIYKEDWEQLQKNIENQMKEVTMTLFLHKSALRAVKQKIDKAENKPVLGVK